MWSNGIRTTVKQDIDNVERLSNMKSAPPSAAVAFTSAPFSSSNHITSVQQRVAISVTVVDPSRIAFHPLPQLRLALVPNDGFCAAAAAIAPQSSSCACYL